MKTFYCLLLAPGIKAKLFFFLMSGYFMLPALHFAIFHLLSELGFSYRLLVFSPSLFHLAFGIHHCYSWMSLHPKTTKPKTLTGLDIMFWILSGHLPTSHFVCFFWTCFHKSWVSFCLYLTYFSLHISFWVSAHTEVKFARITISFYAKRAL